MKTKMILFIFIMITVLMIFPYNSYASSGDLYLNNLEFNAQINSDGSMHVTEMWDINIQNTNTLFKTFQTDSTKYTSISDVKVTDITEDANKQLKKVNTYMYHVTKDCYYGLKNSDGDFEIAWGVGLDNDQDTRKYKIEYTVHYAISKYNDYAELYWQFVGQDFEISAENVKGIIVLPNKVNSKEEIRVWGHTRDLNGTVYVTDLNKIEFELNNFRSGRYLEIRTLFPTDLISSSQRTFNTSILDTAITEETKWADEANSQRQGQENLEKAIKIITVAITIIGAIWFIRKTIKYNGILKKLKKYEPTDKLEYYRELPEENATPGEALFLLKGLYNDFTADFGNVFSATLLNLSLKGHIELSLDKNKKRKEAITIINLNKNKETIDLKEDEKEMLEFLKKAMKDNSEIRMKDLEKYIKSHSMEIEKLIKKAHKDVKSSMISNQCFDEEEYKIFNQYLGKLALYLTGAIFLVLVGAFFSILLLLLAIIMIINLIYCYKIKNRINVLTQKGIDQKEKWKGLKKYMEEFSLLKERDIPELVIWEKYLVYATAFGIADKVLKQLKIVYPNIDQMDNITTSTYFYFMYHSNFNTNFANAINTSIASATYSSGSGSGGGFSGGGGFGGGGRRRRR